MKTSKMSWLKTGLCGLTLATLAKTDEAPIRAGTRVRLAKVMTVEFLGDGTKPLETAGEITKYTP